MLSATACCATALPNCQAEELESLGGQKLGKRLMSLVQGRETLKAVRDDKQHSVEGSDLEICRP